MYYIMLVVKKQDNYESYYKFMTVVNDQNQTVPYVANTLGELDEKVEEMLNGDYRKSDFIIVSKTDYNIGADLFVPTP